MPEDLRVLVVADDPLVRAGLAALLVEETDVAVAGQESSLSDLVKAVAVHRPDALVWDLGWDADGISRVQDVTSDGLPVVVLLPDGAHAAEAQAAGARGVLRRSRPVSAIAAALVAVLQGLTVQDPDLSPRGDAGAPGLPGDLPRQAAPAASSPAAELLTPRELEVARLLAGGLPNKAIADALGITEHTAKFHVASIMGKLGAQSRTEAVVLATRAGLIPL